MDTKNTLRDLENFLVKLYKGEEELSWGLDIIQKAAEEGIPEGKIQLAWYYLENNIHLEEAAQLFYEQEEFFGWRALPFKVRSKYLKRISNKEN